MTNKVGGSGRGYGEFETPEAGKVACDPLSSEQLKEMGVELPGGKGAPAAAPTARPKSVDMSGVSLMDQLEEKLAVNAGTADAKAIERVLPEQDSYEINDKLAPRLKALVTVPQTGGIVPKTDATASEIQHFKSMLNTLEEHGKLAELKSSLSAPQDPIGTTNRVMAMLIDKYGTPSQKAIWPKG